jgi:hypothetical protein
VPAAENSSQATGISAQIVSGFTSTTKHAGTRGEVQWGEVHEFRISPNQPENLVIALLARHPKEVKLQKIVPEAQ